MNQYGLIGYPLSHSFSKKYFTNKFLEEKIDEQNEYLLFSIESMEQLPQILKSHPNLRGLNVTIPYKKQVVSYLDSTQNLPEGLTACNCIKIVEGRLLGFNTDVIGFEKSFLPGLKPHHKNALVLGNGGATEAVVFVLKKLGISFNIVSRKIQNGSAFIYDQLNEALINEYQIIINTTPLGTFPDVDEYPQIPYQFLSSNHYLFDLVYNPPITKFLQNGLQQGAAIKNGADMLQIQADESWKIWNDVD